MALNLNPTMLTVICAWLLIPTGTPDDIITFSIIKAVGTQAYIFLLVLVGLALYHYHISFGKAKKIFGSLWKVK